MMLTGVHVEAFGSQTSSKTVRLCPGVNVVIDPSANANSIGQMIRGTLFGTSRSDDQCQFTRSVDFAGWIEIIANGQPYRLTRRSCDRRNPLLITTLDPATRPNALSVLRELNQEIFEAFFSCDFANPRTLPSMAACLRTRMEIPPPLTESLPADAQEWREFSASPRPRGCFDQRAGLLHSETGRLESSLAELSEEVAQSNLRIRLANARRDLLDRQIIEWERRQGRLAPMAPATKQVTPSEPLARLYERLDEIDCHWRAWRGVQQEIQKRRVAIRDELANAREVATVSIDHPWHRFRESIQSLEAKIAAMEMRPKLAPEENSNQGSGLSTPGCNQVRESLHELNESLEQHQRQSRHRVAAAELKQLRTCYHDLEHNVRIVLRRRHLILEQIHALDPEGAELVLQGNQHFCALAQRDGYWLAREQALQSLPSMPPRMPTDSEFSTERWQLESARQQRIEVHNQIAYEESVLREWVKQRDEMVDRLCQHRSEDRPLGVQRQAGDRGLRRHASASEQILDDASQFLWRLSGERWMRIGLAETAAGIVVRDASEQWIDAARLSPGIQTQIAISLCLAAARHFENKRMLMPLLLCELQETVAPGDVQSLLKLVAESCARGQQFIFVVRQASAAAAFAPLRPHVVDFASSKGVPLEQVPPMALADSHTFRERALGRDARPRQPMTEEYENHSSGEPIYRFPIQRALRWQDNTGGASGTQTGAMLPAESGRDSASVTITRTSKLRDAGVCTFAELTALERVGITTIGKLLDANPDSLADAFLDMPAISTQVRRWQTCCWMLVCVPEMAAEDAQVLFECGITAPQQLEEVRGELLLRKLHSHLTASGRGTAFARYTVERINSWMRSLARARPQWKQLDVRQRPSHAVPNAMPSLPHQSTDSAARPMTPRPASDFAGASGRSPQSTSDNPRESLRFHLHLNDSVDAAPSIGSRVFEQLGQIGVRTVRDFLGRSAEDMVREMNNRRITAETVLQWQQQARIACSVPNMRRHDAQILVACGMGDPEKLAAMNAAQLYEQVDKFLRSKAGMRLIRSGKKPDLAEVTDWIRWARHTRSVQAA